MHSDASHSNQPLVPHLQSHIRTCAGCGVKRPPAEMLRIAAHDGYEPVVDEERQAPGRGAYLCRTTACMERALARRALERSLKLKQGIPAALKSELARAIESEA